MDLIEAPAQLSAFAAMAWAWALEFLPKFGSAILLLIVGFIGAGWAARGVSSVIGRTEKIDNTLRPIIRAIVRYSILIVVGVAVLAQLGVQTASILAALGAAGLAIGLALQGTLSNIAAGMMLLWLRPFNVGDYIASDNVAGTVMEIGLFNSQLKTWDGIYKFVPNSQLWNVILTNYSRLPTRLILLDFGIDYGDDMAVARAILIETARAHEKVLPDPEPVAVPTALADSAVVIQLRAWANVPDFWATRWDLTQQCKKNLEAAGITIPFPQRVLHMVGPAPVEGAPPTQPTG